MFNTIGVGEIIVIAVVALIVMGPEKFPEFAKIAMRAFRDVRGYVEDVKREMGNELRPVKNEINQLARHNPEEYVEKMAGALTEAIDDDPEEDEDTESDSETDSDIAGGMQSENEEEAVQEAAAQGAEEERLDAAPPIEDGEAEDDEVDPAPEGDYKYED